MTPQKGVTVRDILKLNDAAERRGGCYTDELPRNTVVHVRTESGNEYAMVIVNPTEGLVAVITRLPRCVHGTYTRFNGCTWGSRMIKKFWVGRDMHMEFSDFFNTMTTTRICAFTVQNSPGVAKRIISMVEKHLKATSS